MRMPDRGCRSSQNIQTDMQHMGDVFQQQDIPQVTGLEV
jgi:hypothetical protein